MGFENGKVFRVVLKATKSGRQQVNTFHYDADDGISGGSNSGQSLADAFRASVFGDWQQLYDNTWTLEAPVVSMEFDPQNPLDPRDQWVGGAADTGALTPATEGEPSAMCVVVSLRTDHIGRRYRGRLFIGGSQGNASTDESLWKSGWLTRVNNFVAAIPREPDVAEGVGDQTCKWSVYSRTNRAADHDPYLNEITSTLTRTQVHWLRRRANEN